MDKDDLILIARKLKSILGKEDQQSIDILILIIEEKISVHRSVIDLCQKSINSAKERDRISIKGYYSDNFYLGVKAANEARILSHQKFIEDLEHYKKEILKLSLT